MASIYKRQGSPFWWVKYRDPKTAVVKRESTGFKIGVGQDTRKAKELAAERSLAEARIVTGGREEAWACWVPGYLAARYSSSPLTLERYTDAWQTLAMFLDERGIAAPRHLTRSHGFDYIAWRMKPAKPEGCFGCNQNTALYELALLRMLTDEAVRRGYAATNPCMRLGVKKTPPRLKPELTDADVEFIRTKIEQESEPDRTFFKLSFEIARYQGCRLSETYLNPCADVELTTEVKEGKTVRVGRIHFRRKGGRLDTVPLHPALVPLFEDLQASGRQETYARPLCKPSAKWSNFMRKIGMKARKPGVCFHSLRVTAATRMARANVPEAKAMKYLSHASTVVHRTYQRLRAGDLDDCFDALG